jgi:alpha-D-ribose 1-methylphosphonate 5-triphosphate synthase subunit PhnH
VTSITLTPRAEREQHVFRQLLACMSRPGSLGRVRVQGDPVVALVEALVDHEVTFCVHPERTELSDAVLRQTGSRLASLDEADYVVSDSERLAETLRRAKDGTLEYPDRGATVVCLVQGLSTTETTGAPLLLAGPGIKDEACVWVEGFDAAARAAFSERNAEVPLGVDLVMVVPDGAVCCLTRYTRIQEEAP